MRMGRGGTSVAGYNGGALHLRPVFHQLGFGGELLDNENRVGYYSTTTWGAGVTRYPGTALCGFIIK